MTGAGEMREMRRRGTRTEYIIAGGTERRYEVDTIRSHDNVKNERDHE